MDLKKLLMEHSELQWDQKWNLLVNVVAQAFGGGQ